MQHREFMISHPSLPLSVCRLYSLSPSLVSGLPSLSVLRLPSLSPVSALAFTYIVCCPLATVYRSCHCHFVSSSFFFLPPSSICCRTTYQKLMTCEQVRHSTAPRAHHPHAGRSDCDCGWHDPWQDRKWAEPSRSVLVRHDQSEGRQRPACASL